jgi:hypothetical protein
MIADRLRALEDLVVRDYWWRSARAAGPGGVLRSVGGRPEDAQADQTRFIERTRLTLSGHNVLSMA